MSYFRQFVSPPQRWIPSALALLLSSCLPLLGQTPLPTAIDLGQTHEWLLVVCPLVNKGSYADPVRLAIVDASLKRGGEKGWS